jgi:L-aminopeptidase/D-esterase-like protein
MQWRRARRVAEERNLTRRSFLQLTGTAAITAGIGWAAQADEASMADSRAPKTNDNTRLVPTTKVREPKIEFDWPALHIGAAWYKEGPTGCTVFYFPDRARTVADIRGGMHASLYVDYLENGRSDDLDAICFAGGSIYGLEAVTGVTAELLAKGAYANRILKTSGAIIWDLWRDNMIYPDKDLGRAALRAARPGVFPMGWQGVGCSPGCGGAFGPEGTGQGGAFRQIGPTKLAVFTVVNAFGAIHDRKGQVVRGNLDKKTGERASYIENLEKRLSKDSSPPEPRTHNTTLTLVVTNQKVADLGQLARQVHTSMARAIQPFHTMHDGDILYAATTEEIENKALSDVDLGVLASELAWDAVLATLSDVQ